MLSRVTPPGVKVCGEFGRPGEDTFPGVALLACIALISSLEIGRYTGPSNAHYWLSCKRFLLLERGNDGRYRSGDHGRSMGLGSDRLPG